jgi:Winged helix-turn helix
MSGWYLGETQKKVFRLENNLTLSKKEINRIDTLCRINRGKETIERAAKMLGISERQMYRVVTRYRESGEAGRFATLFVAEHQIRALLLRCARQPCGYSENSIPTMARHCLPKNLTNITRSLFRDIPSLAG